MLGLLQILTVIGFVWLLLMVAISFTGQVFCKQVGTLILLGCRQYFEAKKKYLVDLSQLDVPDEDDLWKRKRN